MFMYPVSGKMLTNAIVIFGSGFGGLVYCQGGRATFDFPVYFPMCDPKNYYIYYIYKN